MKRLSPAITSFLGLRAESCGVVNGVITRRKDVPEPVWNYILGGYQVLKKWLSYRESALLTCHLTSDDAEQFTTTSAASPASLLCMRSWMRTTDRVFEKSYKQGVTLASSSAASLEQQNGPLGHPVPGPWLRCARHFPRIARPIRNSPETRKKAGSQRE